MIRKAFLGLVFGLAASCAVAQTAPSPADVGVSKGTPDVFKLKGHDNAWTPFGSVDPSTHVFIPGTNGNIAPNDCVKWGPGLTSAGAACNSVTGGAHPANQLTIYTNHAGLLANVTTPTEAWTIMQQGFYSPGDGGEATYIWNASAFCPGAPTTIGNDTPQASNGLTCIMPIGQDPATAGRYLLSLTNGEYNARQFGMRPSYNGVAFDNSPFVQPMLNTIAGRSDGIVGPDIVFPFTPGQFYTAYYFSEQFTLSKAASLKCALGSNTEGGGPRVQLVFPPGVNGVEQENDALSPIFSGDGGSAITGCGIAAMAAWSSNSNVGATPGTNVIGPVYFGVVGGFAGLTPPVVAAGDGIFSYGLFSSPNGAPLLHPGAYASAVSGTLSNASVTLAQTSDGAPRNYVVGPQGPGSQGAVFWDLPANETYTIQVTSIAAPGATQNAIITGGRRPLKVGALIWTDPFVYGSMIDAMNNQVASATVNNGGSGYVGTSGTMSGNSAPGCTIAPVFNVTASGGVITGVTSVSAGGTCNGANTPNDWAGWTPGGGLSGGSGASFNMTWANSVSISTITGAHQPSPALETGTYKLWQLSAGVMRRVASNTDGVAVQRFPVGIELFCDGGSNLFTGCTGSFDQRGSFNSSAIGRFVTGNNSAASTSMSNEYVNNYTVDILEAGTLSSLYVNENANSAENTGSDNYPFMAYCGTENGTVVIGGYLSNNEYTTSSCLGPDVNGNSNIGVPPLPGEFATGQSSLLGIGVGPGGLRGVATIGGSGFAYGQWSFTGDGHKFLTTTHQTLSGNFVAIDAPPSVLFSGMGFRDLTNPTAIPNGTTLTSVSAGGLGISNAVTGPGVQAGDQFYVTVPGSGTGGCIRLFGGIDMRFAMEPHCAGNSEGFGIALNGYLNSWDIGGVHYPLLNYLGYNGGNPVFPAGVQLGTGDGQDNQGQERVLDSGNAAPTGGLPGDLHLNNQQAGGGVMAWINTSLFNNYLNADLAAGATSVAVSNCPPASVIPGTPVVDQNGDPTNRVAQVARVLGTFASCSGSVLTFQSGATNAGKHDDAIQYAQWRPVGKIANDPFGYSFVPGAATDVATLLANVPCNKYPYGLGVVTNGATAASAGYNAPVVDIGGAGATTRLVFCDGTSWTYH